MAQKRLHQKIVNPTIAKFFVIVLQCNSKLELHCSSILKKIYILLQNVTVGIRSLAEKKVMIGKK